MQVYEITELTSGNPSAASGTLLASVSLFIERSYSLWMAGYSSSGKEKRGKKQLGLILQPKAFEDFQEVSRFANFQVDILRRLSL